MPITRRTSARKKTANCDEENNKENVLEKGNVRKTKAKALVKIEENLDDSSSFISTNKKSPDSFDLLYSSPMKQEVNFKPLSFWSKKVKDLESKENVKKKKCELYELSDTDESTSSQGSNWGKRPKKKGRPTIGRQKNKKTLKKVCYDFNVKNLAKKPAIKDRVDKKEGSIIRERIILRRLNEKYPDVEDKFSFKKVTALGLTSTPGKSEKLNVVGGSTFDFLSPIPVPEDVPKIAHELDSDTEGATCITKEKVSDSVENITPKRSRSIRTSTKVLKKDLKRVSGRGHLTGDYLQDSFTGLDSYTTTNYLGESVQECPNIGSINCESETESLSLCHNDTALDLLGSFRSSEDEMNKSFLHITQDELNGEIGDEVENEYNKGEYNVDSFSNNLKMRDQIIRTLGFLEILFIAAESNIKLANISYNEIRPFPDFPVLSVSLPVCEKRTKLPSQTNFELVEEFPLVEEDSTDSDSSNSNNFCNPLVKRNSFSNVTVRRHHNVFLNFRRSAIEASFEISHDVNNVNQEFSGGSKCSDIVHDQTYRSSQFVKVSSFLGSNKPETRDIDMCSTKKGTVTVVRRLSLSQIKSRDQQTLEKSHMNVTNNGEIGSNQYRSKDSCAYRMGEHLEMYSNAGNDSSVFISSPDTSNTVEKIEYSISEPVAGKEREEPDGGVSANITQRRKSAEEDRIYNATRLEKKPKCYDRNKKREEGNETPTTESVIYQPVVKSALGEHTISDITLGDDFDFPLPIFESTTCATPIRESHYNTKNYGIDEKSSVEKVVQETSKIPLYFGEQNASNITSCRLKPGKKWARSAIILKQSLNVTLQSNQTAQMRKKGKMYQTFVDEVLSMQNETQNQALAGSSDASFSMASVTNNMSDLALSNRWTIGNRTVKVLEDLSENEEMDCSFRSIFRKSNLTVVDGIANYDVQESTTVEKNLTSARNLVLMRCNQEAPLPFEKYFNEKTLKNCKKIGEGTFGEVFMCNSNRVIKIMPIEGPDEVNGERQKKFDEILSEMIIAMELSNLRNSDKYRTNGFCELKKCWCVQGKYPPYLIDLWNDFDCNGRGSENDSPVMFNSDQLYIVLEFGNGGKDLEAFVFTSAEQSLSILFQVAYSLAVAENMLEFEHRDMHWGNILIAPTREKYFKVTIDDEVFKIPTKGVKVTIIDFTLSRIVYNGCCIYNDLAIDPTLFTSEGDYQFEIYRMMKREVMNDWSLFRPKTNIFWLHYIADKMLKMLRYKKTDTKTHKDSLTKIYAIKSKILKFSNSQDFALNCDFE